jgi:hypothetical protein
MGNGWDMPLDLLVGVSEDGAIEVEENRLAVESSSAALANDCCAAWQSSWKNSALAGSSLIHPNTSRASMAPESCPEAPAATRHRPHVGQKRKIDGPSSLWVSNCPAATFENLAANRRR